MTEQTKDTPAKAMIATDFVEIFGKENTVELQLDTELLKTLLESGVAYVTATTSYQAERELVKCLVKSATKMGGRRVGELAKQELIRQREGR